MLKDSIIYHWARVLKNGLLMFEIVFAILTVLSYFIKGILYLITCVFLLVFIHLARKGIEENVDIKGVNDRIKKAKKKKKASGMIEELKRCASCGEPLSKKEIEEGASLCSNCELEETGTAMILDENIDVGEA